LPRQAPGGDSINVARPIKKLDGEALAVFPSSGYSGKFFNHLVELENVDYLAMGIASETKENAVIPETFTNN